MKARRIIDDEEDTTNVLALPSPKRHLVVRTPTGRAVGRPKKFQTPASTDAPMSSSFTRSSSVLPSSSFLFPLNATVMSLNGATETPAQATTLESTKSQAKKPGTEAQDDVPTGPEADKINKILDSVEPKKSKKGEFKRRGKAILPNDNFQHLILATAKKYLKYMVFFDHAFPSTNQSEIWFRLVWHKGIKKVCPSNTSPPALTADVKDLVSTYTSALRLKLTIQTA